MRYRFVASDFDDTLLRRDNTVGRRSAEAIRRFMDAGGLFAVATGRSAAAVLPRLAELELSRGIYLISSQGAVIADSATGEEYFHNYIPKAVLTRVARDAGSRGLYVQFYIGDKIYYEKDCEYSRGYKSYLRVEGVETGCPLWEFTDENPALKPDKLLIIAEPAIIARAEGYFAAAYKGELVFATSSPRFLEAVSVGAGKGNAVKFVAEREGISRGEIICVGDSMNDYSMLAYVGAKSGGGGGGGGGLAVAVANAVSGLKAVADVTAPSCDEDAVAWVIEKYCLGDKSGGAK